MKRKLSILPALLAFGSAWLASSCDSYVDITPLGSLTVDDANTYYELIANPQRCYYPSSFAYLSDDLWPKESKIIGFESTTIDAILFTANENAERSLIADNNLYENMYSDILRCNLVIDNIDAAPGTDDIRTLAKAEARTYRAWNHFIAVNTFAKAYTPATAASDGGVCIMDHYGLELTPAKSTVAEVYDFVISELEASVPLLQETPLNIYHPNRAYGYGLLAQVYLFHRDWEKARDAALKSLELNNSPTEPTDMACLPRSISSIAIGRRHAMRRSSHSNSTTRSSTTTKSMTTAALLAIVSMPTTTIPRS